MPLTSVILRNEIQKKNSRYLTASFHRDGDLVIEGQDLGKDVESIFGCSEYEWVWTIRAINIPTLKKALENPDDILLSLKTKFSDENAADLLSFLNDNEIVFESCSRLGD
jgi:hypothetical protein